MKKLLGLALACALLLTGCGARGGDKGEELGDNTIRPLELTEEEAALLKLVGGSDAEYGLFECAAGEGVSDCTVGTVLGGRGLADRGGGGRVHQRRRDAAAGGRPQRG